MPDRLTKASHRAVGTRQTLKAIQNGTAQVVYIARDADPHVVKPVEDLCRKAGIELVYVDHMKELGRYCSIDVGAAAAAILSGRPSR
ncbi:MAG: ribosomal L7Ae/L30e/S12e/Gadd45 family protein [Limnochordales bacterium]|jgi:Ribosomal protein HS6-type (S12/L30/L7a)|nr:50S ribosomal protein L7Ae-like protein [Bacillota bacterium]